MIVLTGSLGCGRLAFDPIERAADAAAPDATAVCGAGFERITGAPARYLLVSSPVAWPEARDACAAFGPGHALALPGDDAERIALSTVATEASPDRWWLGGTDVAAEGTWLDLDGAPITYLPWAPGEPNNTGGAENCLDVLADPAEGGARVDRYDDRTCTAPYPYICACTLP